MNKSRLWLAALALVAIGSGACGNTLSKEALLDAAANFVINKYENASCEEVAQMQPQSGQDAQANGGAEAAVQAKAIDMLKKNPELREQFINRVAGPIANRMFDCDLIP